MLHVFKENIIVECLNYNTLNFHGMDALNPQSTSWKTEWTCQGVDEWIRIDHMASEDVRCYVCAFKSVRHSCASIVNQSFAFVISFPITATCHPFRTASAIFNCT